MSDFQQELLKEFIIESFELLDKFDEDLLGLEKGNCTPDLINRIFRAVHTIKGTSGCLGYHKLQSVTHVGENVLSLLREGKIAPHSRMISVFLQLSDALRTILRQVESTGVEGPEAYSHLIQQLETLQQSPRPNEGFGFFEDDAPLIDLPSVSAASVPPVETSSEETLGPDKTVVVHAMVPSNPAPPPAVEPAVAELPEGGKSSLADSAIRVDVVHLDRLMNLVGELVLARNQIIQHSNLFNDPALLATCQRLNLITTELQEGVMKTRMQQIGNIWSKFPRIVRDLSQELGKQVHLEMLGSETELDKTIIEAIKDPLTHIIRNSVDHGIEPPRARLAANKPEEGTIRLRAYHEGGQVNIEIRDDGGGILADRVKAKALQRALITPEQASKMSDREAINLVFLPGFSTAEKVTNVSGRGVGMDVVRTNIEKIGGSVEIQSLAGQGTTLKVKIPLTLAIIPALIITSDGDRFAIPQVILQELVRLEGEKALKGIERIQGTPIFRLRGNLLPLVYLNRELKIGSDRSPQDCVNIVVVKADGRPFGLVVDAINDTEEIVVKPLAPQLKKIRQFAGSTIMGDGRVALILDVMGIAQEARLTAPGADRFQARTEDDHAKKTRLLESLLVFRVGKHGRMAVPLSAVHRLEEFPRSSLESVGDHDVILYRERIISLIYLADLLHYRSEPDRVLPATLQVIVYQQHGRMFGLVVDQILDIVEDQIVLQERDTRPGILGPAVILGKVTELIDVPGLIRLGCPTFALEPEHLALEGAVG